MSRVRFWLRVLPCVVVVVLAAGACTGKKPRQLPGTTTTTQPTGRVRVVPSSIDQTGRVDVTLALQQFLASVPNGYVAQLRTNARYRVDGTLVIRDRRQFTVDGNGATVFAVTRGAIDRAQWWVKDGTGIRIRNLKVRGANADGGLSNGAYVPELAFQHGIKILGGNGVELDHVQVSNVYGDFVYVGRNTLRVPSQNVWIHDSVFSNNGRQGISVTDANNVIIERNRISETRRATIDLEPTGFGWKVRNLFVLDNIIGQGRLFFIASHGQGPVDNVVISGNTLRGHDLNLEVCTPTICDPDSAPSTAQRRSNWVVTDNRSNTTVHRRTMRFSGIDGLRVRGNTQEVTNADAAVVLNDVCGAQVTGNEFGTAGVRQNGATCNAQLAVPTPLAIVGRG